MAVTRCVCHHVTFDDLKQLASATGADFTELSEKTGCGTGCGMCAPYVRAMLRTGITSYSLMTSAQLEKLCQREESKQGGGNAGNSRSQSA